MNKLLNNPPTWPGTTPIGRIYANATITKISFVQKKNTVKITAKFFQQLGPDFEIPLEHLSIETSILVEKGISEEDLNNRVISVIENEMHKKEGS